MAGGDSALEGVGGGPGNRLLGLVLTDAQGVVGAWSQGAEDLLGYQPAEAVGRSVTELLGVPLPAGIGPGGGPQESRVVLPVRHRDGRGVPLPVSRHPLVANHGLSDWVLLLGPPPDPTGRREREALSQWLLNSSPAAVALYDAELRCVCQSAAMRRLTGIPDEEVRRGRPLVEPLSGRELAEWERRMRLALETGEEQDAFDVRAKPPHLAHSRVYSVSTTPLRDRWGRTLGVCTTMSDVTDVRVARERLALLNEAGARIGSTLDLSRTAQELTEVIVPRFADFVRVDLLEILLRGDEPAPGPLPGPVRLRRMAETRWAEGSLEVLHTADDADVFTADSPAALCLAGGRSALYRTTDPVVDTWLNEQPARVAKARRFGTHSWILAPIRARGTTLGVVMLTRDRDSPDGFGPEDLTLAEELVSRAAVCLDNARRFTRERTAALVLQRSLLPQGLPQPSGMAVASRYLPASPRAGVGGDWFDVIELSGARVGLVVGDVVGHGMHAAAAMGRLRTAVRTLADVDPTPDELLTRLDDLVIQESAESGGGADEGLGGTAAQVGDMGATCLYAVYDPVSSSCSMARAGHLAPALVALDGTVSFLELPAGPPLGLGGLPFESVEVRLPEGSLLALYTDGLVESRQRDITEGLEMLRRALTSPGDSLEALCDQVVRTLLPDRPADDAALLVVRPRGLDAEQVAVWDVSADPAVVAHVRTESIRKLAAWGLEEAAFVTELVVSELVTNAIRYGAPPIQLRLINDRRLICEVSDSSSTAPHLRRARVFDEGGRGLMLVAQLTERWGTRQTTTGKTIWCEQALPAADGPRATQENHEAA
ncbi:SpoIIE family protein phosphatase [Streptomyces sp. NPDC006385]|uniref:SpoIIE family protein phosphatase n=1 Tax=Streptomyces sp. NPDC006385 TaxID=3156761 RepID=UPI0033B47156